MVEPGDIYQIRSLCWGCLGQNHWRYLIILLILLSAAWDHPLSDDKMSETTKYNISVSLLAIWLFNIAMENGPFMMVYLLNMVIFHGYAK
jgi:uncharacterized membrane protein